MPLPSRKRHMASRRLCALNAPNSSGARGYAVAATHPPNALQRFGEARTITVGVERQGYRLSLSQIAGGEWRGPSGETR